MKKIAKLGLLTLSALTLTGCTIKFSYHDFISGINKDDFYHAPSCRDVKYEAKIEKNDETKRYLFWKSEVTGSVQQLFYMIVSKMETRLSSFLNGENDNMTYYLGNDTAKIKMKEGTYIDITGNTRRTKGFTFEFDEWGRATHYKGEISEDVMADIDVTYLH